MMTVVGWARTAGVLDVELTPTHVWMLVAIAAIFVVLAFFAVAETAINRVSVVKAESLVAEGVRGANSLYQLVARPERFINPVLLMLNVLQTVQAVLTGVLADRLFGPVGVVVATLGNVVLFFVFTESLPKTWAVLNAERGALVTARPVWAIVRFAPLSLATRGLIGLTNLLIPGRGLKAGPFVSEQELLGFVHAAARDEVIEHGERELIESVIEFGDTIVREVMVPRADMVTIDADMTVTDALTVAIDEGFSRLPVLGEGIDDVVGVVYEKDLVRVERVGGGGDPVTSVVRRPRFVPETKKADRMLREMQADKFHLAVVVDEYGGTAGIVTLEDLLEELVGEIRDEFDLEEPDFVALGDGLVRVHGRMPISDLNELLGASLPDDDWDTVGGLIFNTLGHVPAPGEYVDVDGYRLRVERLQGRRITRVRIAGLPPVAEQEPARHPEPIERAEGRR